MTNRDELNKFLVSCFYSILDAEEKALEASPNGRLSLKDIHVIEAVFKAKEMGEDNFSTIANILGVTLGTLTASFLKLESKGYLVKKQDKNDKRIFHIVPTNLGELVYKEHNAFHQKMVDGVIASLSEDKLEHLVTALQIITEFFKTKL